MHLHAKDKLVILDEGRKPLPHCPKCGMFVTWRELNGRQQAMEICPIGEERSWKRWGEEEARMSMSVAF